jgi:hypothetical protein
MSESHWRLVRIAHEKGSPMINNGVKNLYFLAKTAVLPDSGKGLDRVRGVGFWRLSKGAIRYWLADRVKPWKSSEHG